MNDVQILDTIKKALNEVAPNRSADFEKITTTTTIESLGLDSIATMEMVGVIEEDCDITFADEDLTTVTAIADLANLIKAAA